MLCVCVGVGVGGGGGLQAVETQPLETESDTRAEVLTCCMPPHCPVPPALCV